MFNAVACATDAADPAGAAVLADLKTACNEPLAGLPETERRKVARRIERTAREISEPFIGKCTAGKRIR